MKIYGSEKNSIDEVKNLEMNGFAENSSNWENLFHW